MNFKSNWLEMKIARSDDVFLQIVVYYNEGQTQVRSGRLWSVSVELHKQELAHPVSEEDGGEPGPWGGGVEGVLGTLGCPRNRYPAALPPGSPARRIQCRRSSRRTAFWTTEGIQNCPEIFPWSTYRQVLPGTAISITHLYKHECIQSANVNQNTAAQCFMTSLGRDIYNKYTSLVSSNLHSCF